MAKLRAFQLAQELGIENKEFLQVMSSIGIPLKSHMSSIEESEVEAIKEKIANFKRGRTIETRVKGSIIRRRAAPTKPEPAPAPPPPPGPPPPRPPGGSPRRRHGRHLGVRNRAVAVVLH